MFEWTKKKQLNFDEGDSPDLKAFFEFFGIRPEKLPPKDDLYDCVIEGLGGRSFGNGQFKVFRKEDLAKWHDIVAYYFTKLNGAFRLLGYNWSGRCYAIDDQQPDGNGQVVILDVATLKIFFTESDLLAFLNREIPQHPDACLESGWYSEWLEDHEPIGLMECAGYTVPLFLGGEDSFSNMEPVDMEVYWDMTTQLYYATRDLPPGTKIGNIKFE